MEPKENEIWRPVKGYEGLYQINEASEVRSLNKKNYQQIMPQRKERAGYWSVRLSNKTKDATVLVHRILGFAFILNPQNKPFINHIDGNKLNNNIKNLEWATNSENMKHAYSTGLIATLPGQCRKIIDKCSGAIFESIKKAAEFYGIPYYKCKTFLSGSIPNTTCLDYYTSE